MLVSRPTCPHLGCVVEWNSTEHSGDCPWHGSRFAADGRVPNGPALAPLAEIERERSRSPDVTPVVSDARRPEAAGRVLYRAR
ncbi:MAG: Rieske 2Fe-2S domain-containing protein [Gemmatimonadaceae bacterium]